MFGLGMSLAGKLLGRGKLSILVYHQVLEKPDPLRPDLPTTQTFEKQMALLARYFTPVSLDRAVADLKANRILPNAVCVTFDDGYLNNLTVAQPILEKYAIPATVYVATGFSEGVNMWNDRVIHLFSDPQRKSLLLNGENVVLSDFTQRRTLAETWLKKLKYLPVETRLSIINGFYQENNVSEQAPLMMNPEQIRQLSDRGVNIGAHTVNHPILKILPQEEQFQEISRSKSQLQNWTGKDVRHFAYPNGMLGKDLDENTVKLVQQADFDSAVITNWGTSNHHTSPWLLRRFTPWDREPSRFMGRLVLNQIWGYE
ncbi:polysaccharide deacetylase family protein [Lacimicrobium sp. SS2-24]|uniref:polysaccharide deacetylase family protein n=1 Tax=Lacimicrobium sp. SS2-24 TaxID=2005569 RepID=UPI000B4AF4E0|nr:polysaccharide deacetylase family protein [Lacimicrobium sp. SS2-24]